MTDVGSRVTIVTYHYVRELPHTRYPRIKALLASDFELQLAYLQRHYQMVRVEDCIAAVYEGARLPANAALLTFDDGYSDHYTTVFPLLAERGIQGLFFVPARAITQHEVLAVNKAHFVLASAPSEEALLEDVFGLLDNLRPTFGLPSNEQLFRTFGHANRFDSATVIFCKHLVQRGLPRAARMLLAEQLFVKYVTRDETAFAQELYMSPAQLREMASGGMCIGSHGDKHEWMGEMTRDEQIDDVECSMAFLRDIGCDMDNWVISYPQGSYNGSLIDVVRARGCKLGFASELEIATLTHDNAFTLQRLDTNDLPKHPDAGTGEWTLRALAR